MELRSKKDLIENFINSLTPSSDVDKDWKLYINQQRIEELNKIIEEENLNKEETYKYVNDALKNGYVQETGTAINEILPKMSRFNKSRSIKKSTVLDRIIKFFNRFKDIASGKIEEN